MSERRESGVLDTCVYLDLGTLDPEVLPEIPEITAVTLAESYQGVALARDADSRALRAEQLGHDPLEHLKSHAFKHGELPLWFRRGEC
jgi:hypothetical protein